MLVFIIRGPSGPIRQEGKVMALSYHDVKFSGEIEGWLNTRVVKGSGCKITRREAWEDFRDFLRGADGNRPPLVLMRHFHRFLREEMGWRESYVFGRTGYADVALRDTFSEERCLAVKEKRQDRGIVDRIASLILNYGDFSASNEVSAKDLLERFRAVAGPEYAELRINVFGMALASVAEDVGLEKHRYADGWYYRNISFPSL